MIRWAGRQAGSKKVEIWKTELMLLKLNSKTKNIRDFYWGINKFKKGNEPRTDMVKNVKGEEYCVLGYEVM
jgi:hypothetical protein